MPHKDSNRSREYHHKYYTKNRENNWKKEKYCPDCGKRIWYNSSRCRPCSSKNVWNNLSEEDKKAKSKLFSIVNTNRPITEKEHKNRSNSQIGRKRPDTSERNRMMNKRLNYFKIHRNDEDFKRKMFQASCKKPTRPELFVIDLIEKNNLPFEYVGDGKVIIDRLNPDFIYKKKIIEVFSRFWHETYKNVDYNRTENGRREIFVNKGYQLLILWDDELKYNNKCTILNKINQFLYDNKDNRT